MITLKQAEGREAEIEAQRYLEKKGYRLLDSNYRTPLGEVDLVMEKGTTVVFVEVRKRRSSGYGTAADSVTKKKQDRVGRAAMMYVKSKFLVGRNLRFDVVTIQGTELAHIENAFVPTRYTI
ncbi:MAG: YraN family protein [Elusimicrobia bacterium]|nr:YraN family protein [Elusimicrobiota bacterium]